MVSGGWLWMMAVVSGLAAAGEPPTAASTRLQCVVTHELACTPDGCSRDPVPDAHIDLLIDVSGGQGNLCTVTYCREVEWLPLDDGSSPRTFGALRSSASGSTQDRQDDPVVDYYLWIAPARTQFNLIPTGDGAAWAGACNTDAAADTAARQGH